MYDDIYDILAGIQRNNITTWRSSEKLILCMGSCEGEVFPVKDEHFFSSTSKKIINFISLNKERVVCLGDAYEVEYFLALNNNPLLVSIVGAFYNTCVANSAILCLQNNIPVVIWPHLTLTYINRFEDDSKPFRVLERRDWFLDNLSEYGVARNSNDKALQFFPK